MPASSLATAHRPDAPALPDIPAALELFAALAVTAGSKVMHIWAGKPKGELKADRSPVCEADVAAETILLRGLAKALPDIPVVSEEAVARGEIPQTGRVFILVDPLDGTREFLSENNEFTVNVALIADGRPIAGVVYAPALGRLWIGGAGQATCCNAPVDSGVPEARSRQAMNGRVATASLTALISRSHPDASSEEFLARMCVGERKPAGSSLKFCLLAEGKGDVYPRCGPTMQWDVAAGDAVLRAAGGVVVDATGQPLLYGPGAHGFKNGPFVAWADASSGAPARATLR